MAKSNFNKPASLLKKAEHYTGAEVFDEMQKSYQLMKSIVVDMGSPFPQTVGDGDFDGDDAQDGAQVPTVDQWPERLSNGVATHDPVAYFTQLTYGEIGAPAVSGDMYQPDLQPDTATVPPEALNMGRELNSVESEDLYKCMSCNDSMHKNMDGTAPAFCKSCGSMSMTSLPGMPTID